MASGEETGRGPGTWPSGLGGDAAAAGAAGVAGAGGAAGDLRSASPCGSAPGRRSQDDDASSRSSHLRPHLRSRTQREITVSRLLTFALEKDTLGYLYLYCNMEFDLAYQICYFVMMFCNN